MYFADPGDGIMYADVPTQGVNTLYTAIGDVLGWVCVVGLLGLIPLSIVLRIKQKRENAKVTSWTVTSHPPDAYGLD
jgi:hypothetical protein